MMLRVYGWRPQAVYAIVNTPKEKIRCENRSAASAPSPHLNISADANRVNGDPIDPVSHHHLLLLYYYSNGVVKYLSEILMVHIPRTS